MYIYVIPIWTINDGMESNQQTQLSIGNNAWRCQRMKGSEFS